MRLLGQGHCTVGPTTGTTKPTFAENATFSEILSRMSSIYFLDAEHSKIIEKVAFSAKVHFLVPSTGLPSEGRAIGMPCIGNP